VGLRAAPTTARSWLRAEVVPALEERGQWSKATVAQALSLQAQAPNTRLDSLKCVSGHQITESIVGICLALARCILENDRE
jgi:hypothetical protein